MLINKNWLINKNKRINKEIELLLFATQQHNKKSKNFLLYC